YHVKQIRAVATSALRTASNGEEFLAKVSSETGIEAEIIGGDREAALIYQGVHGAINMTEEKCLIMDIGGGSVEFIICNKEKIFWKMSYDIGVARLIEHFFNSDPISETDIKKLK
ncbi:MAG: exopolyphosphatase, partial [Pedobacter sp.]